MYTFSTDVLSGDLCPVCLAIPMYSLPGSRISLCQLQWNYTYANHSYLDLTLVGNMDSNKVLCHTSLQTCCSSGQGAHRGDWYSPSGSQLPFVEHATHAIAQKRATQRVELVRINDGDVSGIYLCNIATAVDVYDESVRESVYIGLYTSGGKFNTNYLGTS